MVFSYNNISEAADKISLLAANCRPFLFAIDYEGSECIIIENPLRQQEVLFSFPNASNVCRSQHPCPVFPDMNIHAETFDTYKQRFDIIHDAFKKGDSFVANLTVKTPIETPLSLQQIFWVTDARYSLYVPNRFVCFSPECFITINDEGVIATHPMKGTIDADLPNAAERILNDTKESAEHATVVDLLRNDLSIHAQKVAVPHYRYITKIHTNHGSLLQVSSMITGQLPADWRQHLGAIITSMLPAGSICGAPKSRTVEITRSAEGTARGFYTGIAGYYDGKELDSTVLIRYIEEDSFGNKYYRSGGGITAQSDAHGEYKEMMKKIYLPMRQPTFSEVIRIKNGQPQNLAYHIQRMEKTVWDFYHAKLAPFTLDVPRNLRGIVKCRIVYDKAIRETTLTPYRKKQRQTVAIVHADEIDYRYKSTDRRRLEQLVEDAKTDDIIIIRRGLVSDAGYCNLVFEDEEGCLFTPAEPLLAGTCRQRLIDEGRIKENTIRREDIRNYKYVYFINAMTDLSEAQRFRVEDIIP